MVRIELEAGMMPGFRWILADPPTPAATAAAAAAAAVVRVPLRPRDAAGRRNPSG